MNKTRLSDQELRFLEEKVLRYEEKKIREFDEKLKTLKKKGTLEPGGRGFIQVYGSHDHHFFLAQKLDRNQKKHTQALKEEAEKTRNHSKYGVFAREIRRCRKGYSTEVRYPTPFVYESNKQFLMEFMPYGDLRHGKKRIDTYDFLKQTAKLLEDVHTRGYVHGDIKLNNLVLGYDEKIRLIDLDSLNKEKFFRFSSSFTPIYADLSLRHHQNENKFKLDIYSTAVSVLAYEFGVETLKLRIKNACRRKTLTRTEKSNIYKQKYLEFANEMKDASLAHLIKKMLTGKYESFQDLLQDFEKLQTVKDKKDLKIEMSRIIKDEDLQELLHLIHARNSLLARSSKSRPTHIQEINDIISEILKTSNIDSLVAQKFENNHFTTNPIIISRKSILRQQKKSTRKKTLNNRDCFKDTDTSNEFASFMEEKESANHTTVLINEFNLPTQNSRRKSWTFIEHSPRDHHEVPSSSNSNRSQRTLHVVDNHQRVHSKKHPILENFTI
jgi:serine/threonine protein kinase